MGKVFGLVKLVFSLAALAVVAFMIVFVLGVFTALDSTTKAYGYEDGGVAAAQIETDVS